MNINLSSYVIAGIPLAEWPGFLAEQVAPGVVFRFRTGRNRKTSILEAIRSREWTFVAELLTTWRGHGHEVARALRILGGETVLREVHDGLKPLLTEPAEAADLERVTAVLDWAEYWLYRTDHVHLVRREEITA